MSRKELEVDFYKSAQSHKDSISADLARQKKTLDERAEKHTSEMNLLRNQQQSGSSSNDKQLSRIRKELEELRSEHQKMLDLVTTTSLENVRLKNQVESLLEASRRTNSSGVTQYSLLTSRGHNQRRHPYENSVKKPSS